MPADSKKNPLERVNFVWHKLKAPTNSLPSAKAIETTLRQLHDTLAAVTDDGVIRDKDNRVISPDEYRRVLREAIERQVKFAAHIGELVTQRDVAVAVSETNRLNATQPRAAARLISPEDAKEKWKEFLRQGSPELAAVKFTEYFGDPGRYEPESPPSKRTIARALKAVGYIQQK